MTTYWESIAFMAQQLHRQILIKLCRHCSVCCRGGVLFLLFIMCQPIYAATPVSDADKLRIDLLDSLQFTFTSDDLTIENILLLEPQDWQKMSDTGASMGFKLHKSLWLKTQLNSNTSRKLFLLIDYAVLDEITVYSKGNDATEFTLSRTGEHLELSEREIMHRKLVVPLQLSAGLNDLYIKVVTDSSYTVPVMLLDEDSFYESEAVKNMFLSALFGGAIYMILLNLFGGVRLKHSGYLFYVAFAGSFLLFNMTMHGYMRFYFGQPWPEFYDLMMVLFSLGGGASYAMFLTVFLPLKKYFPIDYYICHAHTIICGGIAILSIVGFVDHLQMFSHMLNAVFAFYSMILAWRVWRGGSRNALYLFLGWLCLMSSVVLKAMVAMGILPYSDISFHMFDLGMTLNFALISLGLASRIVDIQQSEIVAREEADSARSLAILNMEHYRALFEYAPIPMFKVDADDRFIAANRAFISLFGFASEEELIESRVHSKDSYCVEKDYFNLINDLKRHSEADIETKIRVNTGGELWLRITVRAIEEEGRIIFEGACIDVTAQVERQEFEKAAHKREVNQLEALVAGVAHYLNTPLGTANTAQSVVSGKTKEVETDLSAQKLTATRLKNFLNVIKESGNVIKSSVEKSINVVERFKELNPDEEQVSLSNSTGAELLKNLKVSLKSEVKNKVNIVFDDTSAKSRLLPVTQLLTVLKKLVHNAYSHGKATEVYIALKEEETGLHMVIKDNGKGLSNEVKADDLFAPFFAKTLSLNEVSGLDLFVVKTIIQNRLNGHVHIEEESLPALVFHIQLPGFD